MATLAVTRISVVDSPPCSPTAVASASSPEISMVTRGSQQAIDLVARALLSPGDVVGVEALGNPGTWTALRLAGAELKPLPVDEEGPRGRGPGVASEEAKGQGGLRHPASSVSNQHGHDGCPKEAIGSALARAWFCDHRGRLRSRVPLRGSSRAAHRRRPGRRKRPVPRVALQDPGPWATGGLHRGLCSAHGEAGRPSPGVRHAGRRRRRVRDRQAVRGR